MASLSLRHIYKKYPGGVTAVSDFNLEVKDKEFLVLVGPSGCGKSTTLRMIAGLEEISEGELFIGDRLVNDVAPKDRKIAMVFQNYALYPHMSVFENMAFGLKLSKVPKETIKKKVEDAARILDITHLLDRKPKALSGGQKQRVALGRAIVRDPQVFLLDEPVNIFVAGFIGTPQMNFLNGSLEKKGEDVYFVYEGNYLKLPKDKAENPALAEYIGKEVVAGLRPECIEDNEKAIEANYADSSLNAYVDVTELMGAEIYLYLNVGEEGKLTARVSSRSTTRAGDTIKIGFEMERIHIFDKDTERCVLH